MGDSSQPKFYPLEFEGFRKEAGLNAFTLSPTRWIEATNAIGIVSQAGRYGGTFAQTDFHEDFLPYRSIITIFLCTFAPKYIVYVQQRVK